MKAEICSCFAELNTVISRFRVPNDNPYVYRGHGSVEWKLIPGIYRHSISFKDWRDRFDWWTREAHQFIDPPENPWNRMAIAQHHEFMTPLLDWAENPLVAIYFAVCKEPERDGDVYILRVKSLSELKVNDDCIDQPGEKIKFFYPEARIRRIVGQTGRFTFHPTSTQLDQFLCDDGDLHRITIPKESKQKIQKEVNQYWVNESTIYPDLDGMSRFFNWWITTGCMPDS